MTYFSREQQNENITDKIFKVINEHAEIQVLAQITPLLFQNILLQNHKCVILKHKITLKYTIGHFR